MHIPDGFLELRTAGATAALSATGLYAAFRHLKNGLPRRKVPLMGLAAAFVFVAQMLNFPVAGGTSGHLVGAVLVAVLLGPSAAIVVMTAVLSVQCLLFADGGILALGANVFNMAIVAVLGGYAIFRTVTRFLPGRRGLLAATSFASWCSTLLAALCCAGELAASGVVPWGAVFPAMLNVHMLIGLGEALITTLVILAIERTRPDLVNLAIRRSEPAAYRLIVVYGLLVTTGLVLFVAPFASGLPDGLEHVAESLGFAHREVPALLPSPIAGYELPLIGSATAATWVAGLIGAGVVFALALGLSIALTPKAADGSQSPTRV